jgi:hydrogenase expression/formation protein HypE
MKVDIVMMAHGSGGMMSQQLIDQVFKQNWDNPHLELMLDGALLDLPPGRLAMSTDSFVITPIFFPGGDIGKLAICGTVNDLVACGAKPLYLSTAFIIEEGLPLDELKRLAASMAQTARAAGVMLVTGDTKVVEKGSADRIFINTTGIGVIPQGIDYRPTMIRPGDQIIVTGPVGDHGLAILAQREGLRFSTPAISDCAPLVGIRSALESFGGAIRCMRDPTRGGLATVLNELAQQSGLGFKIQEGVVPVSPVVQGACDMLGMDPLYMANEGKMVMIVSPEAAMEIVAVLRLLPEAAGSAIIGEVTLEPAGMVLLQTELGAQRILGMLEGEHLPRIC